MRCVAENMGTEPCPLPEGCNGASLIPGFYRGWMTAPEKELFDAKKYDLFNNLADKYNEEHGYGYGKEKKRKRSAREREMEGEYIQYA